MKSINNFIIEKLKINSNTKITNELVEDIFYKYWGFADEEKEIIVSPVFLHNIFNISF